MTTISNNVLGRPLDALAEEQQPAGQHHVIWDADTSASGVYPYRIVTGEAVATKKMLLAK